MIQALDKTQAFVKGKSLGMDFDLGVLSFEGNQYSEPFCRDLEAMFYNLKLVERYFRGRGEIGITPVAPLFKISLTSTEGFGILKPC